MTLRALCSTLTLAAALLVTGTGQSSADTAGAEYVALGDSGAATTGAQNLDTGAPLVCLRSTTNTPRFVAASLGLRLDDRSCSSARIPHLTTSQSAGVAPQFDGLGPGTKLVTVHIGANDAQFTSHIVGCQAAAVSGGCAGRGERWDADIDGIAGSYAAALREISRRAPNATVVVDGWPQYMRDGGCPELLGLAAGDAGFIQSKFDRLNTVVAREAVAHGAIYVSTREASAGRDACAPAGVRWIEPVVATQTLLPYHPTVEGMRGVAEVIVAGVRAADR
ncbi:SGNH/GDSL hydrolase family protein [Nocardia sp. 2]|uniref:SGNH/GDSL hydrolase family protein n=1 Tax=Nocardia acididurans TaxID=2802282 RepID=A0ABS1MGC3_9NOCA|nr:SGNH/GDSL hydrolase family protein [Nocardia acididurans]MBL1079715.1 SGNH/GDSL hydrolase family protein [Nocardia acididurans]